MATNYPSGQDTFDTIPAGTKMSEAVSGRTHRVILNDVSDAVEAIETELGTDPAGGSATVKARLEKIEDGTRLGTDSVGSSQIAADAVGSSQIAANAVGSSELADNAVDTAAIQNNAVTDPKVPVGALGATKIAGEALVKALFDAKGDLIAGSGNDAVVRVPAGADGTLLGYDSTKPGGLGTFQIGNLLTANQASGGDTLGDTTGFGLWGGATYERTTATAASGTGCLKVNYTAAGDGDACTLRTSVSDMVAVKAGETITLHVKVKQGSGARSRAHLWGGFFDESNTLVAYAAQQRLTVTSSFQSIYNTLVVPVGATRFAAVFGTPDTGADTDYMYFDEFGVWKGAGGRWAMPGVPIINLSPFTVGTTPPVRPTLGAEWADTSSPPVTVLRKWDGTSWLVWLVTDATIPAIGSAAWGGYMAGIIDTTRPGSIGGTDPSQAGLRYLLIVSPKSIEFAPGKKWKTSDDAGPTATQTLWDGLAATEAMFAAGSAYEAATYCRELAFPQDGGSRWYLPAKNELELLYRNLKPTTEAHHGASGVNPASDPTGVAYVPGSSDNPSQSGLAAFQQGGAQALEGVSSPYYWSSSESNALYAWTQHVGGSYAGIQANDTKTFTYGRVRPVRRFVL